MKFCRNAGLFVSGLGALLVSSGATAQPTSRPCETHFFPAAQLHSVGEDFDQVKRVDQDLRMYDQLAGKPLDWLTPARQVELAGKEPLAALIGVNQVSVTVHDPLTRLQATDPARAPASGNACILEISTPQLLMERGGLAKRSLRIFGVVRHYENGQLIRRYSGFAAVLLTGFRLQGPQDAVAATALVEQAYSQAMNLLVQQSLGTFKPQRHP